MKGMMITIALADDHVLVRQGLRLLLESNPGFAIVDEAANGIEALKLVKRRKPNVLLLDLMMPGLDGLETARRISRLKVNTRVIILTMYGDEAYLLDALRARVAGYVIKESCGTDLFQAIRDVVAGRRYVSPPLSEALTRRYVQQPQAAMLKCSDLMTPIERKVFQLALEGVSSADIGVRLKLNLLAVQSHLAKFVGMLGVGTHHDIIPPARKRRGRTSGRTRLTKIKRKQN